MNTCSICIHQESNAPPCYKCNNSVCISCYSRLDKFPFCRQLDQYSVCLSKSWCSGLTEDDYIELYDNGGDEPAFSDINKIYISFQEFKKIYSDEFLWSAMATIYNFFPDLNNHKKREIHVVISMLVITIDCWGDNQASFLEVYFDYISIISQLFPNINQDVNKLCSLAIKSKDTNTRELFAKCIYNLIK